MKTSSSLSCQADGILMLFWISTSLIQLLRSDAKLKLFLQALCFDYSCLEKSYYYKEHLEQSVSTGDLSYQTAAGTAALAMLAPSHSEKQLPSGTQRVPQSGPHSGCSGLLKSQLQSVHWEGMVGWELIPLCWWTAVDIPYTFIGN